MQQKPTIITIAGKNGSGKSTTARAVAKALEYTHKSTGDFMRAIAQERGITLEELGAHAETDPSIDQALDDHNKDLATQEHIVLDSRLGFYFIPESFRVFLEINPTVAAQRVLNNMHANLDRHNEAKLAFNSVENIVTSMRARLESERKRYKELYGIEDHTAHENFDFVLDTGTPEYTDNIPAIVDAIVKKYQEWLKK